MNPDEQSEQIQESNYDTLKKQLEIEKLNKEIKQIDIDLARKWYKKPQWVAALSPIFLGLITFIVAFASGFLQKQSTLNKIQEETFNQRRQQIADSISKLQYLSDSLSDNVVKLASEKQTLEDIITELTAGKDSLFDKSSDKEKLIALLKVKFERAEDELALYRGFRPSVIFLDFDGHSVKGSVWSNSSPITTKSSLSDSAITDAFNRVAEQYKPFKHK